MNKDIKQVGWEVFYYYFILYLAPCGLWFQPFVLLRVQPFQLPHAVIGLLVTTHEHDLITVLPPVNVIHSDCVDGLLHLLRGRTLTQVEVNNFVIYFLPSIVHDATRRALFKDTPSTLQSTRPTPADHRCKKWPRQGRSLLGGRECSSRCGATQT